MQRFDKRQSTEQDRLSALPDNVTDLILSRLPIKEAAKTSILSKHWRYRWTSIPSLVFLPSTFTPPERASAMTLEDERKVFDTVNQILSTHKGNIRMFHIKIALSARFDLTSWFHNLRKFNVQIVNFFSLTKGFKLPSYLFCCETLTSMSISMCVFNLPVQFKGLPRLDSLFLHSVTFVDNDSIDRLVSSCPYLSYFSLKGCEGYPQFKIYAPNLVTLRVYGDYSICLSNTPKLINITLYLCEPIERSENFMENQNGINLINFVNKLSEVHFLDLDDFSLQHLSINFTEPCPSTTLSKLKILKVCWAFECLQQTIAAIYLLRSSPILEHLKISWLDVDDIWYAPTGDFWTSSLSNVDWKFDHLKFLSLKYMVWNETWMKFLEFVFESSPILEKVKIDFDGELASEEVQSICERLLSMCRASPKAKIIIKHRT